MENTSSMEEYMLPCITKKILGVECLGCGIQRSIALILHGDFIGALYMYPAIYPMLALGGIIVTNMFFPLKYATKIIWFLGTLTAIVMIGNYVWKHFV